MELKLLKHDTLKIITENNEKRYVVYVDPFKIDKDEEKADLILITHDHYDHYSPADCEILEKESTIYVAGRNFKDKIDKKNLRLIDYWQTIQVQNIKITGVPAYNIREDRQQYHPKSYHGFGYIIELEDKRIYHAGDTDKIPEMQKLGKMDYAFVPVSGKYVMGAEEAASAINEYIKPKIAVPMHYGVIVGTEDDAQRFKELCEYDVKFMR